MFLVKRKQLEAVDDVPAPRQPTAVIIGARAEELEILERQIADVIEIIKTEPDPLAGLRFAREHDTAFVLLYLDHSPDTIMAAAHELAQTLERQVIMVSRDRDPDHIVRAMRAGVRDFVYLEHDNEVRGAVLSLRAVPAGDAMPHGRIVAVYGAKGGSGATTIATNLAGALLRRGGPDTRAALVDLDLQLGDAMVFLDLAGSFGLRDLLRNLPRLDEELLDRSLIRHASGLRVVAETATLEESEPVDAASVTSALRHLRAHLDYVVVDGLGAFSEQTVATLDAADTVVLTFTQDVPALKNASRCIQIFQRLGYPREKVKLVLNRFQRRGKLDLDAIADALGADVDATIANDFPTVAAAINAGELLADVAPRARVTRDLDRIGELLDGAGPANGGSLLKGGGR